ncbi:N-acetylmuramoyl-L-alanine amidase [Streptomyces sp. NPDC057910]|uniref:N-acetylmuramoyl-L-alanine amidase n=1 Tax=Streptomyces sp. NPDC057910 TaxID=3346278 RepID=UPI0036E78F7B
MIEASSGEPADRLGKGGLRNASLARTMASYGTGNSMTVRKKLPAIALGVISLTVPLAAAGTSAAAKAIEVPAEDSSQVEDATLTDRSGEPSRSLLSAKTTTAAQTEKVFSTGEIAGKRFSSIGLSWKKESTVDKGLTAETRIHRNGAWEPWRDVPLELDEGVAEEAKRAGAPTFYTQAADGVEVRFTSPTGSLPQDLRLSFIDPAQGPAASPPARQPQSAQAGQPKVNLRKDWGADETLADPGYKTQPSIKAALVHHTAGRNKYTQEQVPEIINGIYVDLIKNQGYGDFPYHFIVDQFGGIWEGRKGSIEMQPGTAIPGILGGHAQGFNTNTFGVAMLGNFERDPDKGGDPNGPDPSEAMVKSLADLLAWKGGQYKLDPEGATQLVSAGGGNTNPHPVGTVLDVPVISSHKDVNVTACPGGTLYEILPDLRKQVAERLG